LEKREKERERERERAGGKDLVIGHIQDPPRHKHMV